MKYSVEKNSIIIHSINEFNPEHIFECGQIFCYKKINNFYFTYPEEYLAVVYKNLDSYYIDILNGDVEYFVNFFDLNNNYELIKNSIINHLEVNNIKNKKYFIDSINNGYGIRILKQDVIETIVSFIFSANNNIKRIKNSLNLLRKKFGSKIIIKNSIMSKKYKNILESENFYSFPKLYELKKIEINSFKEIGAGYRANYLVNTIANLSDDVKNQFIKLNSDQTVCELQKFSGVGRKVAECITLFSLGKTDVFPVDTWIKKVYLDIEDNEIIINNQNTISKKLTMRFGTLSGYIQQYLYFYKREKK